MKRCHKKFFSTERMVHVSNMAVFSAVEMNTCWNWSFMMGGNREKRGCGISFCTKAKKTYNNQNASCIINTTDDWWCSASKVWVIWGLKEGLAMRLKSAFLIKSTFKCFSHWVLHTAAWAAPPATDQDHVVMSTLCRLSCNNNSRNSVTHQTSASVYYQLFSLRGFVSWTAGVCCFCF